MLIQHLSSDPRYFFAVVIVVVVSICIHELAHGLAAVYYGDPTPIEQERITLNPLVHMGPVSLIAMLLTGFAWGQMPIDPTRLRGRFAEINVAAAGPASNVLIALVCLTGLGLWIRWAGAAETGPASAGQYLLLVFGLMNFALAMFNLIPWPPLDGSHILASISPGYRRMVQGIDASGASIIGFIVLFALAGRLIMPASAKLSAYVLSLSRGD